MKKTPFTRIYYKFAYHLEDLDCSVCLYWQSKKLGCKLNECCCEDEKREAIAKGRIKRERGSMTWDM